MALHKKKSVAIVCWLCAAQLPAQNARIKIDLDRTVGQINKHVYGNFVEHLGSCVYGGIYDTLSSVSDERAFAKM